MTIARLMQQAAAGVPKGESWLADLANASYDSVSFSTASQETSPSGLTFKPDGTKMYVVGFSSDSVHQYSLSTAFDLSTASYDSVSFSVASQDTSPYKVKFNNDGTKIYMVGISTDTVYQYSLSTAYDLSTASYDSVSFSVSGQDLTPLGLSFKPDGTKMYVVGSTNDSIFQYSLSTAFDLSTASYDSVSFSVASQETSPHDAAFSPSGVNMYIIGSSGDDVNEFLLSTAWDVSTATYVQNFSVAGQDLSPTGLVFNLDGSKMYITGNTNNSVFQYSTAAAAPAEWTDPDLANASYDSVSFSVAGEDGVPVGLFFKPDGLSLYVTGGANKNVFQYSLSTAWDLSTASYASLSASIASQVSAARGLQFSSDGTKMFVLDSTNDAVFQYSLSTAWDVSSASYDSVSLSVTFASNGSFCMSSDGLYLYTVDEADDVDQYTLSTAWDLSTATFTATKNDLFVADDTSPSGIFFSPTGDKVFICGYLSDVVAQGTLSSNFDITTASRDAVTFSVSGQETLPYGVFFKPDGSKMYVVGLGTDNIYQYSTS